MNQNKGKANGNARNNQNTKKQKPKGANNMKSKPRNKGTSGQPRYPKAQPMVAVASAYATGQTTRQPKITRNSADSCRIVHRELVASIIGSTNYTIAQTFSINPGLASSFPWLSSQAQGWEKYRFHKFKVCAYTRTGSNVPGSEILIVDYDAADAAPVNEQIASAYHGTSEDAPWKDIGCVFDSKRLLTERFIRSGGLAANLDIKTYDVAKFFVATVDGTAVNWSKLWFEYDIELINQQLPSSGLNGSGTLQGAGGSIAAATPFGAAPVSTGSFALNASGTNVVTMTGLSIGTEYSITATLVGTVINACLLGTLVGGTAVTVFKEYIETGLLQAASFGTFTANATSVSVTWTVTATTVTSSNCVVSALNPTPAF
jgi:hypothetical protein